MLRIWLWSSRTSLVVTLAAMTGRDTLQARPRAAFDGMKTYGTFYGNDEHQIGVNVAKCEDILPFLRIAEADAAGSPEAPCPRSAQ